MEQSDKRLFMETIRGLAVNYRIEATKPLLQILWLGLADLTAEEFANAAKRALLESKFMPTVADFREYAKPAAKPIRPPYWNEWKIDLKADAAERARIRATWPPLPPVEEPKP